MGDLKVLLVIPMLLSFLVLGIWCYSTYKYSNEEKKVTEYIQEKLEEGYTCYYKGKEVDIDFDTINILGYTYKTDDENKTISFYDKEVDEGGKLEFRRMYIGGRWYTYWY